MLIAMTFVGCGAAIPRIKPFKIEIQQGNVVTSEMLLKLRPGMTKSQVQFIMGTPLLVDTFHANRWDYFYQLRKEGEVLSQRRVILDFEKDLLVRVRGDVVPKGATVEDVTKLLETEADKKIQPKEQGDESSNEADTSDEPILKPIDVPDIKPLDAASASTIDNPGPAEEAETSEGDAPKSVLAVPIPVQPSDLVPKVDMQVESENAEKSSDQSTDVNQEMVTPVTEKVETLTAPDVQTLSPTSIPTVDAVKNESSGAAKQPSSINNDLDKKLIFRLDRQLDTNRINAQENAKPIAPLQDSVVKEIKESQQDSISNQEKPGVFERLLERIGF